MRALLEKAKKIRLLICDVDGVFTDGLLYLGPQGTEYKPFHIHDGLGIKHLLSTGVEVAIITSRHSEIVENRMRDLGIKHIYQNQQKKLPAFHDLLKKLQLTPEAVAYVGDDLPDVPLLLRAGLAITVPNADAFVKGHVHWQTTAAGGHGAIREICELIMQAQGTLAAIYSHYTHSNDDATTTLV